jgi:hypothetical protein
MGRLDFPVSVEQITNHFTVETLGTNVVALCPMGGELLPSRFEYLGLAAPIVRFAQVAELDVAGMRQSYLDPEGKPLFRLWTEPYRPGSTPRTFPA